MRMGDASTPGEDWPAYLRRMTKRPGWSVAKLARESGIHRATIFGWMKGEGGVTIDSVRRVAAALSDDPENALRAAGRVPPAGGEVDEEVALIMRAPVSDEMKQRMLTKLRERREREKQQRLADLAYEIELAKRED